MSHPIPSENFYPDAFQDKIDRLEEMKGAANQVFELAQYEDDEEIYDKCEEFVKFFDDCIQEMMKDFDRNPERWYR